MYILEISCYHELSSASAPQPEYGDFVIETPAYKKLQKSTDYEHSINHKERIVQLSHSKLGDAPYFYSPFIV